MDQATTARPRRRIAATAVFVLALLFGLWGLWRLWMPAPDDVRAQLARSEQQREQLRETLEELRQRVATLSRSDQISRDANRDLQNTLAERDEQIAGLRADVAFYERLVGPTAQRHGLSVHALRVQPQNGGIWHFTSTLTQNLNRGAVSEGGLTLSVEGTANGQLQTLEWNQLRQRRQAEPVEYSFKYFQEIEGDIVIPRGFTPVRVNVRLQPESGSAVEESFTWAQATGSDAPALE
jgi:hypothetical protein